MKWFYNCDLSHPKSLDVTGVDYAEAAIEKARARASEAGVQVRSIDLGSGGATSSTFCSFSLPTTAPWVAIS